MCNVTATHSDDVLPAVVADARLFLPNAADVVDVTIKARRVVIDVSHIDHECRNVVKLVVEHAVA